MGWFRTKTTHPLAGLEPYDVRQGTQIPLVNVEPGFVQFIRETKVPTPRLGLESPIAIIASGDRILAYYDDQLIGEMDPSMVPLYIDDMNTLARRKKFGRTVVYIKPEGFKTPHSLGLNWGSGGYDGGLL